MTMKNVILQLYRHKSNRKLKSERRITTNPSPIKIKSSKTQHDKEFTNTQARNTNSIKQYKKNLKKKFKHKIKSPPILRSPTLLAEDKSSIHLKLPISDARVVGPQPSGPRSLMPSS